MPILALIAAWPRVAGGLILVSALVLAFIANNAHQRTIGAQKVVAKIEKATNENVKKADAARRSVDDIPDSGLFDNYRRD
ncbi:MAG: hypothetical protein IPL32_18690 [Chloracidobacterium sp.]|nr:hypothetical protein [Chloracidobacterium sp.]